MDRNKPKLTLAARARRFFGISRSRVFPDGLALDGNRGPALDGNRGPALDGNRGHALDGNRGPALDGNRDERFQNEISPYPPHIQFITHNETKRAQYGRLQKGFIAANQAQGVQKKGDDQTVQTKGDDQTVQTKGDDQRVPKKRVMRTIGVDWVWKDETTDDDSDLDQIDRDAGLSKSLIESRTKRNFYVTIYPFHPRSEKTVHGALIWVPASLIRVLKLAGTIFKHNPIQVLDSCGNRILSIMSVKDRAFLYVVSAKQLEHHSTDADSSSNHNLPACF